MRAEAAPLPAWAGLLRCALFFTLACGSAAHAQDAASLKARHASLREALAVNTFQRPLHVESSQSAGELKGDIYAVVEQPYAVVSGALQGAPRWCDVLMLHLNVKRCRASTQAGGERLSMNIGRKYDQPLEEAYRFEFLYRNVAAQPDYLQVALNAEDGPLGTSRYRVVLEAVPLDARRSFVHLSYGYAYGVAARLAMEAYLATAGRGKVGFSTEGKQPDGQPAYIGGMRGVVERNTMRYYLAIESFLGALSAPPEQQLDKRLNSWHTAVERYPVQLHELERGEYLAMKHREVQRQQAIGD